MTDTSNKDPSYLSSTSENKQTNSDQSVDPKPSLSNLPHEEIPLIVTDEGK